MAERIKNYINGKWVDAAGKKTFESRNPADTRELIGVVADSDATDVEKAVEAAARAFRPWAETPAPKRGEILYRAAEQLVKRKAELGEVVCREMGKVLSESLGDVQEAIDMTYYMAGEGRRLSGETVPSELPNKDAKAVRVPVGVFAQITPWNFPIAIPSWKITPALIAGNTVVFKPAEETPVCAARFVEILHEAGLPPGVLNMVHGFGPSAGEPLVRHPNVQGVSFTGSNEVGERVAAICGSAHKHFTMETGGKNPIIVMDDADLDLAVEGAIWGGFGTAGQRCTAASRLIVHEKIHDRFVRAFSERAAQLKLGNGLDKKTQVGPVVSEAQQKRVLGYIEIGKKEGAKLILGGHPYRKGKCAHGHFIEPTIFVDVTPKMRIAQEEIFGPVVSILRARSLKEAIEIANDVPFGLSAAIYSRDVNNTAVAERDLNTGLVYINASTIGAEIQLPFGGAKRTGLGPREAGGRGGALELYTQWKVIYRDFSGRLQKAQIDKE
ncbi:MAG TPA: aldehyde dehydrogenase family protein [Candidatus Manganitrophaceae bacterium]|nr:aldehyde dehydrogenase family protein [Candidatus Manganitrophaceae bacterium]